MDITLYELNVLNQREKGSVLWDHGVHLTERFDETYGYSLFHLNDFYVEVKYNSDLNVLTKFTALPERVGLFVSFPSLVTDKNYFNNLIGKRL